jgi:hypothetical protein
MVRPIDLQDNLSKTQAAERMNQIQKAHGEMGQRQVADELKEKASEAMKKARASEKTDMVIIREDQKKQKEKQEGQDKKNKKENGREEKFEGDSSEHLDLRG